MSERPLTDADLAIQDIDRLRRAVATELFLGLVMAILLSLLAVAVVFGVRVGDAPADPAPGEEVAP